MNSSQTNNLIIDGIKTLLDEAPFYGHVIMNLSREMDVNAQNALSLKWQAHQWLLVINPKILTQLLTNHKQIALALAHEALHIIWQHPLRYAKERRQNNVVDIGTDIAVNQYLPQTLGELPHAMTLQTIFDMSGKLLPLHEDSSTYMALVAQLFDNVPSLGQDNVDGHGSWSSIGTAKEESAAALALVIKKADEDTKLSGRGKIDSRVQQQIDEIVVPKRHWRSVLRMGLSQMPNKRQSSRARFNRRQAYRLDLLGEISTYDAQVAVFIDNSASISNQQVGQMLATVLQLTQQLDADVRVFSFDTQVHDIKKVTKWVRHAGGGTTFQCIFDTLLERQFNPMQTVVIILTDGEGEKSQLKTKFKHVYWLLPPQKTLSIQKPFGQILRF